MRVPRLIWLLLAGLLLVAAACSPRVKVPVELPFREVASTAVPAELAAEQAKGSGAPGLFLVERGGETYVLIQAGEVSLPSALVRVMEIRTMADGKTVRILARVEPSSGGSSTPALVMAVEAPAGLTWNLRLSKLAEEPIEAQGIRLSNS
jgi:hypothetical protein